MASYHMQINTGGKGAALEHAQYIDRDGPFTEERYGEVAARRPAHKPGWAREGTTEVWGASDEVARAHGNTTREYELALPRELSRGAQIALVQRFAEQELGTTRPYQWAIHTPLASDGKEQPHVHLMFSDRQHDGIERGPEQFFKRYNAKNPERGGARKLSYGVDKEEAARTYEGIRERWAKVQNLSLEQAGVEVRVDHRSLAAQGITREPEVHRGPAVSGIEGRGEVSQVGERQREQQLARAQAREKMIEQVRVVTREEMATERVAARERRDLAREVTGKDRALVLPRVEADRREQLGRAQAAAERRVERRQGLRIGELGEKLVAQARALRERIGRELERVKEWVREHFPDPLKQLKERSRDLFEAVAEKARGRRPGRAQEAVKEPERGRPGDKKRGMFDGLKLDVGLPEMGRGQRSAPAQNLVQEPAAARRAVLAVSLDRYAQAWMEAVRMRERDLPVLPHQATEIREASLALDAQRPGATQDLTAAMKHEPSVRQAMVKLQGPERVSALLAGLQHEEQVRRDPNLRVERLVKEWKGLEAKRSASREWEKPEEHAKLKKDMTELTREFKRDPQLESIARQRSQQLGIDKGSTLDQVLRSRTLDRGIEITLDLGLGRGLGLSR